MNLISNFLKSKAKDEILSGSAITFALRILGMGSGYIFSLLVNRNYGVEAWGMFSLAFTVFSFGSILSTFGLDGAILRIVPELVVKNQLYFLLPIYRKIVGISAIFSIVVITLVYLFSSFLSISLYRNENLSTWIEYSALLIFPISICNINSQLLRGFKKIKEYVFLDMVARYLFPALFVVAFKLMEWQVNVIISYFMGMLVVTVLSFVILYLEIKKHRVNEKGEGNSWNNPYALLNLAYPLVFSSTLIFVKGWIDTIMLGHFRTEMEVGIYNIYLKVAIITTLPITSFNSIGMPKFGELHARKDYEGLRKTLKFSAKLIFLTTLALSLGLLLVHEWLLEFFGKEFIVDKTAFYILLFAQLVNAFGGSAGYILQMTGHQNSYKNCVLITILFTITMNMILIPTLGVTGAAISTFLSTFIYNGFLIYYINKKLNINPTILGF